MLADGLNADFAVGVLPTLAIDAVIAAGYTGVAATLRPFAGLLGQFRTLRGLTGFLGTVGVGTLIVAGTVCTILVLMNALPPGGFVAVVCHFWIGDLTGIVGLFPALMTASLACERWRELPLLTDLVDWGVFALMLALAVWVIFGVVGARHVHFFYLMLLPMIWIGARHGLPWCAVAILAEQLALIGLVAWQDFALSDATDLQTLLLAIAITGLLVGTVVTERQQSEWQIRRQQAEIGRMARIAAAGALGSAIAHEISQPIAQLPPMHMPAACFWHRGHPIMRWSPTR